MKTRPKRVSTLNIRNMPVDLRDQYKAYCAARGTNMSKAIKAFMKKELKDHAIPRNPARAENQL